MKSSLRNADLSSDLSHQTPDEVYSGTYVIRNCPWISATILNNNASGLILLGMIFVILLFGLCPLNFQSPNRVEWLKNEPGVRVTRSGHLYKAFPFFASH
jgi:hypothetical protein